MLYLITHSSALAEAFLFDTDSCSAPMPQVLLRMAELVEGAEDKVPAHHIFNPADWDVAGDQIEFDRNNASGLDEIGTKYTLPDGSVVESTRIDDVSRLCEMADGFVQAMLWSSAIRLPNPLSTPPSAGGSRLEGWEHLAESIAEQIRSGADVTELADRYPDHFEMPNHGGLEAHEPTDELIELSRVLCARFIVCNPKDISAHVTHFDDPVGGDPAGYVGYLFYMDAGKSGVSFIDNAPSRMMDETGQNFLGYRTPEDERVAEMCERLSASSSTFGEIEHIDAYELADGKVGL